MCVVKKLGWLVVGLFLWPAVATASFHTLQVRQIYSNADGTIQYVMLQESQGATGQNALSGHTLTSTSGSASTVFTFPSNLPSSQTANKFVLLATAGFANLKLVTPDYTLPTGFLAVAGGTVNFSGLSTLTFPALADSNKAVNQTGGLVTPSPTNFADATGSLPLTSAAFSALASVTGAITSQSISLTVNPALADVGSQGSVFVVGILPSGQVFLLTPSGFVAYDPANPGVFKQGSLASTSVTLVSSADLSPLRGLVLFAGYGKGSTGAQSVSQMVGAATFSLVHTVQ
jgi:hypothetical protein